MPTLGIVELLEDNFRFCLVEQKTVEIYVSNL